MAKITVEANFTMETKRTLDEIIAAEQAEDSRNKPPRSRSAILERVFKMGCRTWKEKQSLSDADVGSG